MAESTTPKTMKSWQINSFGKELASQLQLNSETPIPEIKMPNQVLVKIKAATINPIDTYMVRGYGSKVLQIMREKNKGRSVPGIMVNRGQEFPIILGRDFSGIVEAIGSQVKEFKVGDQVYGFVDAGINGSHAEYVLVLDNWIQPKPDFLSFTDAASIPFVAMTTWSALRNAGNFTDFTDKNFLVLGGSGGVGTVAIQYLKSKGAKITTTCSASAFQLLKELGADFLIDYKDAELDKLVESHGPYDCIYDLAGGLEVSKKFIAFGKRGSGKFITLNSTALHNMDNYGLVLGAMKTGSDIVGANIASCFRHRVTVKWGFFSADGNGFKEIAQLVKERKIKSTVEQIYKFSEFPEAFERVDKGHLRGKIVVEV